jgi:hypothetical protein
VAQLPVRGPGVRELGLRLPPERMPLMKSWRPLKRWRWIGVFGPDLMLCAGDARVAGIRQRWWARAHPDGTLDEGTGKPPFALELGESRGGAVEVASPHGRAWIWTRKRLVATNGGLALVDDSAGYHARHTTWYWSAGSGRLADGRSVAWNLVDGVHDAVQASERTVWVDGEPSEAGPVEFAPDLSRVGGLEFSAWSAREHHTRRGPFRSDYRQPFGSFRGELPGGLELAEGYGVMEWHDALW